ncbi:U32 family peptidase [Alkalinema sp. FACHB-956]|uniref:U32 family peptidase n=1 Tax=Alkalinema sp. FACHB-956 TaxID=2692768 RepID=UPI0016881907|nr:U32 family peptidase [Alkalinema sp. FACHB-956]MBD2328841.1 U32 family peptidase [Alkalinema sp. FACHB-956]
MSQSSSQSVPTSERSGSLQRPELLAPAGNWECARAAVENGADAIYFGLDRFNARMRSQNFTEADLPELMAYLHRRGVKGYVTLNTLIFPQELADASQYLRSMISAGVDAVIVQDIGICRLIRHLSPDFPIHASTQMTVTSAAGVEFAQKLGCQLVVLARECSLKEIRKIQTQIHDRQVALPLEVFVHGALCVAYSGQCLTSESLGGRSANRGECAQACRMPYELIADGKRVDLGDRQYLLSPQDLSGLAVLPELVQTGISCLKIEGRLKAPEYVASVTRVYREALDRVMAQTLETLASDRDRYSLEMSFSRGLYTGWFEGINNQELVHARFGKKRGVYLGDVIRVQKDRVTVRLEAPLKPGNGVVFDNGHPAGKEEGGRVYTLDRKGKEATLTFGRDAVNFRRVYVGDRVWKTSDPEFDKQVRQSYEKEYQFQQPITIELHGTVGETLVAIGRDQQGHTVQVESTMALVAAHSKPLTPERLQEQFARLGNTPFQLDRLDNHVVGDTMLPVSELNRLRRSLVEQLETLRAQPKRWQLHPSAQWHELLPESTRDRTPKFVYQSVKDHGKLSAEPSQKVSPELIILSRNLEQLKAALESGITTLYCEFEDPCKYQDAMQLVTVYRGEQVTTPRLLVAPPRITKPSENWILQQVQKSNADGYLIRNYDQLEYFVDRFCVGDFSLNVANPITANYFKTQFNLAWLTASYDLNVQQLQDLLQAVPTEWMEVTIHQHMPMFHMEHCVFCAFLSEGTDFTNCGRPCEKHSVKLRDRVGTEHILQADAGCRNTVFNGTAQTGAEYVTHLMDLGVQRFRIEFVNESPKQVKRTIECYQQLLKGDITGAQLWRELKLQNQLGVTRGSLEKTGVMVQ